MPEDGQNIELTNNEPTESKPKRKRNRNTNPAEASAAGTGTGTGNNTDNNEPTVKDQGTPRPVVITPENVVQASQPTPKRVKKNKVNPEMQELADNIKLFTTAIFAGIGHALNPIWNIREDEAEAIALPAARIMDRLGATESTNAWSDYIALGLGLSVIIIPRMVVSAKNKERVKAIERPAEKDTRRNYEESPNVHGDNVPYAGTALA